jgi:SAM-dependent methyltransferase
MTEPRDDGATAAYYDTFSASYDDPRGGGYHRLLDDLEMAVIAPLAEGRDVLELGCGTGLLLQRVAPIAKSAKGIDLSPGMLASAKERGLDVTLGSVTELPWDDASFDLVFSVKVLAHVPDIRGALAEAARVTRPGGRVAIELYNPLSLRYLAKKIFGPQPIGDGRTEADVYTRWDWPWAIDALLPPALVRERVHGIRVLTPVAAAHRVPVLGDLLARGERWATRSPIRWAGGFLMIVARRT